LIAKKGRRKQKFEEIDGHNFEMASDESGYGMNKTNLY